MESVGVFFVELVDIKASFHLLRELVEFLDIC